LASTDISPVSLARFAQIGWQVSLSFYDAEQGIVDKRGSGFGCNLLQFLEYSSTSY
jgi:hypothetical protein